MAHPEHPGRPGRPPHSPDYPPAVAAAANPTREQAEPPEAPAERRAEPPAREPPEQVQRVVTQIPFMDFFLKEQQARAAQGGLVVRARVEPAGVPVLVLVAVAPGLLLLERPERVSVPVVRVAAKTVPAAGMGLPAFFI